MIITLGQTGQLLLVLMIVLLVAGLPRWPYSRSWGYGPSGILSLFLIILAALMIMGRI